MVTKAKYKIGQTIVAKVSGEVVKGVIDNIDEHKGEIVYDLKDMERYVYERQIITAK